MEERLAVTGASARTPSRRRNILVGAVVVLVLVVLSVVAAVGSLPRGYVVVPGADMADEARVLCESLDDVLPAETSATWSLRGGFHPHSVIDVVGVFEATHQDSVLDTLRERRRRGDWIYPVEIRFHEGIEAVSRELEDGSRVTRVQRGAVMREERLD